MKLKVSVVVAVLVALLVFAGAASGHVLTFGYAKRAIARETAATCNGVPDCKSWSVQPCRRQSYHRIDCLANFFFPEGQDCQAVMIARLEPYTNFVNIRHKRIIC